MELRFRDWIALGAAGLATAFAESMVNEGDYFLVPQSAYECREPTEVSGASESSVITRIEDNRNSDRKRASGEIIDELTENMEIPQMPLTYEEARRESAVRHLPQIIPATESQFSQSVYLPREGGVRLAPRIVKEGSYDVDRILEDGAGGYMKITIPGEDIDKYNDAGHEGYGLEGLVKYFVTDKDPTMRSIASYLTNGVGTREGLAQRIVNFSQQFEYKNHSTGGNWNRIEYPVQILNQKNSECDGSTSLAASLAAASNLRVSVIGFEGRKGNPGHVGLGVEGDFNGTYFLGPDGVKYYFAETTSKGWKIGMIPKEYEGRSATVIPIGKNYQMTENIETKDLK